MLKSKVQWLAAMAAAAVVGGSTLGMACGDDKAQQAPVAVARPGEASKAPVADPVPVKAETPKAEPVAAPRAGVTGTVKLQGDAPKRRKIKMDADPKCAAMHPEAPLQDDIIVGDGGVVQWSFVYVKAGVTAKPAAPATPVVIDQKGCKYEPHVLGVQVGQELLIKNSDDLLHNIHALPFTNKEFNFGQPTKGLEEKKKFDQVEVMVKVKCDVHPWMSAWVGVLDHPYYSVTDAAGKFDIKGLPDGKYTVVAWHEKYKDVTSEVEVKGGAATPLTLELSVKKE